MNGKKVYECAFAKRRKQIEHLQDCSRYLLFLKSASSRKNVHLFFIIQHFYYSRCSDARVLVLISQKHQKLLESSVPLIQRRIKYKVQQYKKTKTVKSGNFAREISTIMPSYARLLVPLITSIPLISSQEPDENCRDVYSSCFEHRDKYCDNVVPQMREKFRENCQRSCKVCIHPDDVKSSNDESNLAGQPGKLKKYNKN